MPPKKSTGDHVAELPTTSRKVLEKAPMDGRYVVPYTVGRVFVRNGWGSHLGKSGKYTSRSVPTSLFQLNEEGLKAAAVARQRARSELDDEIYAAVYEATTAGLAELLEDFSIDQLIREAEALVERVDASGHSAAGARGYLAALLAHRDQKASVPA